MLREAVRTSMGRRRLLPLGLVLALALAAVVARPDGTLRAEHAGATRGAASVAREPPASAPPPACPSEMVAVDRVCIDRWEAHLVRRTSDGTFAPHPHHARPLAATFVARSVPGVRPQAYISRIEAAAACENAGKRLCSASEWFRACRGEADTVYPYGPEFQPGRCNVGKPHLLSLLFGKDPSAWRYDEHFNHPELNQRPGFLAATGEFSGCVGDYGAYDLVGNLHEWVSDRVDASLATKLPLIDGIRKRLRAHTGKGVFMGGFFSTTHQHGRGCAFVTIAHEPAYHDYSTGFRCCREP